MWYRLRTYLSHFFPLILILVLPASTNYSLHDFGFGSGGGANLGSTTYGMTANTGELSSGTKLDGTTYDMGAGLTFARQANVPAAPTFTNPSSYYNRLHIVINTGSNPSDAVFAIAISSDDFVTTQYVKSDNTVGNTLALTDYQTYTNWGGASGEDIIGLTPNTTYKVKVKAMHDSFTETEYGPTASVATSTPSVSFDIDVSSSDEETGAPYTLTLGTLTPGSVTTGSSKIWIDLATNGEAGGFVYAYSANAGLKSTVNNYTISSSTTNLASAQEGFGAQSDSVSQTTGGPLAASAPYNGASDNVGALSTTSQTLFTSSDSPISGGRGAVLLKAKISAQTPSAGDYSDTITMIASGSF